MSFEFGLANELDPKISLYCLLIVVCFLIFFGHASGVIEYFLERSPVYNRILQTIYKELMIMGLVSFSIVMYEATAQIGHDPESTQVKIITSIDFAHIILFFIAFFFVALAFYLMALSLYYENCYHRLAGDDISNLLTKVEELYKSKFSKILFEWIYWPFSSTRNHIEFHLLNDLFHKTYLLSTNFDFAAYLSISFGRYALKTINRSLLSWLVFLVILIINYIRIVAGFSCAKDAMIKDSILFEEISCEGYSVRMFLFSGVLLVVYFIILLGVSRLYKHRLVHSSFLLVVLCSCCRLISLGEIKEPKQYLGYLTQKEKEEADLSAYTLDDLERYHNKELKHEIGNLYYLPPYCFS
jgi:hypothetical protein